MPPTFEELAESDLRARLAKNILDRKILTEDEAHRGIKDMLDGHSTISKVRNTVKEIILRHASTKQLRCLANEGNSAFAYIMK